MLSINLHSKKLKFINIYKSSKYLNNRIFGRNLHILILLTQESKITHRKPTTNFHQKPMANYRELLNLANSMTYGQLKI
ncbi:hypothetical protein BpHYR1_043191 [Brachionus plicatilis]|uniref:Uncharacterized protein n=1 Tax=Brachionus plicatilis TaxID=10195 RepID=A0A3M7R975_BRAPC|nr:hypothetical protein BpHYR1_043191 [Brachionus plicatilis]